MLKSVTAARFGEWAGGRDREAALKNFMGEASLLGKDEKEVHAKEIANDPERVQMMINMTAYGGGNPAYPTVDGFLADMADFETPIDFASITVPTLVVHGDKDGDIPFSQAEQAANGIPNSELYKVENGWHCLMFHNDYKTIYARETSFMKKHLGLD